METRKSLHILITYENVSSAALVEDQHINNGSTLSSLWRETKGHSHDTWMHRHAYSTYTNKVRLAIDGINANVTINKSRFQCWGHLLINLSFFFSFKTLLLHHWKESILVWLPFGWWTKEGFNVETHDQFQQWILTTWIESKLIHTPCQDSSSINHKKNQMLRNTMSWQACFKSYMLRDEVN